MRPESCIERKIPHVLDELSADIGTVGARKLQIENGEIVFGVLNHAGRLRGVGSQIDRVMIGVETALEKGAESGIAFRDQKPHGNSSEGGNREDMKEGGNECKKLQRKCQRKFLD